MSDIEDSLNRISAQLTQIEKSLPPRYAWKRRFVLDLASGMARGIGFSIGFTVLGDQIDAPKLKTPVRIPRLMLHAYSLAFTHPTTGERMRFCAPLPAAFEETLQKLR